MGFGRPSKYSKAMVTKSASYLKNYETAIPSIEGLAYHLGIARSTVYEWAKDEEKQDFSDILEQILQQQFLVTMDGAIKNDLNAQIAKLVLGKHGYKERSEQELTGPNGGPVQVNQWNLQGVAPKRED